MVRKMEILENSCLLLGFAMVVVGLLTALGYPVYDAYSKFWTMLFGVFISVCILVAVFSFLERVLGKFFNAKKAESIAPMGAFILFSVSFLLFSWASIPLSSDQYSVVYEGDKVKTVSGSYFAIPYSREFVYINPQETYNTDIPIVAETEHGDSVFWNVDIEMKLILPEDEALEMFFIKHSSIQEWKETVIAKIEAGTDRLLNEKMTYSEPQWEEGMKLPEEARREVESLGYEVTVEIKGITRE